ncbi:FKBP-type peptidyl-prolyl cis-trans isomerase [Sphingomonas sp. So64.6b]|uniref:FKBP-type peptidyl-prolyl cis-trans isomerase n=1 Tax=Sphingomonas sp. So64.6b TaxID=2997354 RepID=UPI0016005D0A|nr:FKBP-type peptidyl-prolyl cis-trans isomerase [Sphingomonas sp. So64.6b]QNA84438.1 FKBP-type peptidyl-prolyl cis-trans isomerase [Sphingomonas sp. So64.6b]
MSSITAVPLQPVKRRVLVYLWIGIALVMCGAVALAQMAPADPVTTYLAKNRADKGVVQTVSGLQYKIIEPGKGDARPTDTDVALVNYEGKLTNGTTFDKSQQPTPMPIAGVVPGFSEALKLMPKGSKYRFWIKPSLGYGDKATGPIPANSVLMFDVELLDFLPEATLRQMQMQQQMMQQQQGGAPGGMPPGAGGPPPGQ